MTNNQIIIDWCSEFESLDSTLSKEYNITIKDNCDMTATVKGETSSIINFLTSVDYGKTLEDINHEFPELQQNTSEVAMYHYYLTEALLTSTPEQTNISDLFNISEDAFVIDIFKYSVIFWVIVDSYYQKHGDLLGVAAYDLPIKIAPEMWVIMSNSRYPTNDEFKKIVNDSINICWKQTA